MRHFKHYCKLIISTIAVVLVFACQSITAHADPLTGAMIANQIASGFSFAGFSSSIPSSISDVTGSFYTDLVPWEDLVAAAHAYVTIRDIVSPQNSVEVTISPEISQAGSNRTGQFVSHYNIAPGGFVQFGDFLSYQGYVFNQQISITVGSTPEIAYKGAPVGYSPSSWVDFSGGLNNLLSYRAVVDGSSFRIYYTIGSSTSGAKYLYSYNIPLSISYTPSNGRWCWIRNNNTVVYDQWTQGGLPSLSSVVYSASWAQDGQVIDSDGRENVVVLPSSYVQDITYTSGEVIDTEEIVEAVLDAISVAGTDDAIISSTYAEQPVPPGEETVSDTLWTSFTTWFEDYFLGWTEVFGDIYDGVTDFQESFGDWVEDVASGWTEVFGDIYDDLHGFRESFGDWVDDVASGWTEVFGDIYSTLSGISSTVSGTIANTLSAISTAVQSLVQTIENADFNFVDAFWKNFLTPFIDLFNTIKSHLSIWHYVVEWLASISSVFTFFLGVFSGAGYGFLLPIYACFAGTVVIAVYRRFGK